MTLPALPAPHDPWTSWGNTVQALVPFPAGLDSSGTASSTTAMAAAITASQSATAPAGFRLVLPAGTFKLPALAVNITTALTIEGVPGRTILDFGETTPTTTQHFSPQGGASLTLRGLVFRNAGRVVRIPNTGSLVEEVCIEGCRFENIYCGAYAPSNDADAGNGAGINRFIFVRNYIDGASDCGVQVRPDVIRYAYVAGNEIRNVVRGAILLGNGAYPSQTSRGRYSIIGNTIDGVSGPSDANGIQVFGDQAEIIGNSVRNTLSSDNTDCEGIYTKCVGASVIGNTLVDAGGPQGSFAIKGSTRTHANGAASGYDVVLANNTIRYSPSLARTVNGIWVQEGDSHIYGNTIEGATDAGINIESDIRDRVHVNDNHIYGTRGSAGITASNCGTDLTIDDNVIIGVDNSYSATATTAGISIAPSPDTAARTLDRVSVSGNRISSISGATNNRGIRVNSSAANVTIQHVDLVGNKISSVGEGISFGTTGTVSDVWIDGNSVRATTAVLGTGGVTSLAYGTNSFAAGVTDAGSLSPPVVGTLASDAALATSSTTLVNLSLSVAVVPGTYILSGMILYDATTTGKLTLGFTVPSGTSGYWTPGGAQSTATSNTSAQNFIRRDYSSSVVIGAGGVGTTMATTPIGRMVVTNAGTVTVQAAQGASDVGVTTVYAGSFLRLDKVG